jgi:hypothetical protein
MPEPLLVPEGVSVIGKPFPRPCARCRSREVWPITLPYEGVIRYEGRSYTVVVPQLA